MRALALTSLLLLAACASRQSPAPTPAPTTGPTTAPVAGASAADGAPILQVAGDFARAALEGNAEALGGLIAVPFTFDGDCDLLATVDEVTARFLSDRPNPEIQVSAPRAVGPQGEGLAGDPLDELRRLSTLPDCDPELMPLARRAAGRTSRYAVFDIVNPLEDGPIVTVVRVSQVDGRWLVTGFGN